MRRDCFTLISQHTAGHDGRMGFVVRIRRTKVVPETGSGMGRDSQEGNTVRKMSFASVQRARGKARTRTPAKSRRSVRMYIPPSFAVGL